MTFNLVHGSDSEESAEREIAAQEQSARRERDDRRLLVALHQRSRLALRRGDFGSAARDNAEARRLAETFGDRLPGALHDQLTDLEKRLADH